MGRIRHGGAVTSLLLAALMLPAGGWWGGWDSAGPGAATLHRRLLRGGGGGGGGGAEEEPGAFDMAWGAPASHAHSTAPLPTIRCETDFCLLSPRQSTSMQGSSQGWGGGEVTDRPNTIEAEQCGGEEGDLREYAEWEGLQMAWSRLTEDIALGR
jgi:hypothetical protein